MKKILPVVVLTLAVVGAMSVIQYVFAWPRWAGIVISAVLGAVAMRVLLLRRRKGQ